MSRPASLLTRARLTHYQLHTTHGPLHLELFLSSTPKTSYNFLALAASGFYTSSPIHRLIPSFMFQTGSPSSSPDPKKPLSTSIYGSDFEDEIRPTLRHNARGIVSMANKGPGTNGSQFFVLFSEAPHLDGKNTVFGRVLVGEEGVDSEGTLRKLEEVKVDKKNRPLERVAIERVVVHANPLADE